MSCKTFCEFCFFFVSPCMIFASVIVCEIWPIVNFLWPLTLEKSYMTSQWRHHPFDFLFIDLDITLQRAYLNNIWKFLLIGHKRASWDPCREVNKELWRKLDITSLWPCFWPKVTHFNRVRANVVSNCLLKTVSKSV